LSFFTSTTQDVELNRKRTHRTNIEAAFIDFIFKVFKTMKDTLVLYQNSYTIPE